jgi:ATP-dependent Clp protease adaptor protein ClpS
MSGEYETSTAVAEPEVTVAEPEVTNETRTRKLPPFNVVILNDEEHSFHYVIEMLIKLFAHSLPTAQDLTWRIHTRGRAIVYTTHKEKAELKRDQVLAYGADPRMSTSKGPLRCYIEPAE